MEQLDPSQSSAPFMASLTFPVSVKTIVCPQCQSVFFDQGCCESCGHQANVNRIGAPFDEKSFYALKEDYLNSLPQIVRIFSRLEFFMRRTNEDYQKKLLKRLKVLGTFFTSSENVDRRFYQIELKDLISEIKERKLEKIIVPFFDDPSLNFPCSLKGDELRQVDKADRTMGFPISRLYLFAIFLFAVLLLHYLLATFFLAEWFRAFLGR